ncbi:hypothetical protein CAPTEDRAFT_212460 [Capitella teleta]|uniref:Leucine-rich repeat and WD repeat-containing protein 1 LRR domain-containing protein n=1 Tax=Capitella teleta TaxID=283909 RepID=R7TZ51_CAPTE|nr:hypothetical protein CAPTEDRAFT_212460 [Capitella teleta]|eukprot:ELT99029.1 hypothetical protein CAPTEDRAFT_212460 [Capitella teleta]
MYCYFEQASKVFSRTFIETNEIIQIIHGSKVRTKPIQANPKPITDPEEQNVKFTNIQSERESLKKSNENQKFSTVNADEIVSYLHTEFHFTRVRVLDMSCNFISVIENLNHNQDLRELKLYDNSITEISNLDGLKELCILQLQHNEIKCVGKGLYPCKKLRVLRLDSNRLFKLDIRELAPCSNLTSVDLSNNRLDSVAGLNCLPNLQELLVVNNRLRVITDLSRCKKLQEVDVSYNKIADLSGLKGLSHLQILHASHNQLTSMKTLGKLKGLQELNVSANRLIELKFLVDFYPGLEIADVSENCVETWQQVVDMKSLDITPVYNLKFQLLLNNLRHIVELYVAGNPFCLESGLKPHYFLELQQIMPQLDVLDGAHTKKQSVQPSTPLMRPMSASTVVSSRQVESQLNHITHDIAEFEKEFAARFESLRSACNMLPSESPSSSVVVSARPSSKCGKRSRIQDALHYADRFDLTLEVTDEDY